MNFKKVLIAIDESTFSAHAADVGMDLARSLGAEAAFVTVVDPAQAQSAADSGVPASLWMVEAQREAQALLVAFRDRAAAQPPALVFLQSGAPAAKIVEAAANWPADVIVIGTHGRGAVGSILLGSVAQSVLRHAPCPVMIVRAPK